MYILHMMVYQPILRSLLCDIECYPVLNYSATVISPLAGLSSYRNSLGTGLFIPILYDNSVIRLPDHIATGLYGLRYR